MKPKFPASIAKDVARELCAHLKPITDRLICAGSLRRRKPEVGDVEILFVPKFGRVDDGTLFGSEGSLVDAKLEELLRAGVITKRPSVNGSTAYGPKNKLLVHVATGMPVDLFTATEANWFNYLVCRTGPSESNVRIAEAAKAKGFKWHPYKPGFSEEATGRVFPMGSEEEVFRFVGLPYAKPWDRQ
jgi:DNA polymerase/3'-5' exonuclease PolX